MSKIDTTDTDSDGLYDIYETAGMRISNGTVMYSFVSIADSDNDGLMDGEEITPRHDLNNMPIWREIAIKSKLGEMVVKHIYFDYKSDPKKNDTDGDGDSDVFDPNPVVYLLNGYFSKQISALEKLANKYYTGSDWLMKYTVGKAKWYVFMFIRQFNSLYNNGTWSSVGGEIDKDFIEYVKNRDIALYNYFNNIESIYANTLLGKVDLRHLAATATVCIYNTDLIDAQYYEYKDYDSWYKLWTNAKIFVDNGKNIVQTEMREYHFNNLAGWAGDLQTLMNDVQLTDVQLNGGISVNSYDGFYKKFSSMLCDDIYSFSQQDMYADIDAYNIVGLIEAKSIGEACLLYYDNGYKKRVTKFTNNWSKNRISDLVSIYTKTKYLGIERWPLFECDFTEEQSKAARDSFVDYLLNRRNEE